MKRAVFVLFICLLYNPLFAQYTISGGNGESYPYTEDLSGTGIEAVYLLNTLNNAIISYSSSAVSVKFHRYRYSLADKTEIPQSDISTDTNGNTTVYTVSNLMDGYGYLVEENGGLRAAVWIIDYNTHQPILTSIETIEEEDKCEFLKLFITKSDELSFYTNGGAKKDIRREYTITYNNLEWDAEQMKFVEKTTTLPTQEIGTEVIINAPLMNTKFTLREEDRIAEHFKAKSITSTEYNAIAVEAQILTEQERRNAANEKITDGSDLGGSAPATIHFYGYGNEPITGYYTWFIYNQADMKNPIARYTDRDIKYTFERAGGYTVRLEVADQSSICADTTSVSFNISESFLDVPNYFSPGDSPGSNDEFRVAYKSLVRFKCTIFNRWGIKLYQWTDPAKGWDGKHNGRYVPTGVYFYAIEAEGSDGIKYKKGGDINVFRTR